MVALDPDWPCPPPAAWDTDLGDRLENPGIATAGGVTSIAGSVYAGSDAVDAPALRLSFRQLDEPGARTRRWDGLDTDIALNGTPIAAGDDGHVYVGWTVQRRAPIVRRSVVLRFGPEGDPCVLADLGDDLVNALALRADDLVLSGTLRVGRVPR